MAENTLKEIQDYLGVDGSKFRDFWTSLTPEEKADFKATELPKS